MKKFLERYFLFLKALLVLMFILLVIPVFLQVISRFVGFIPRYIWTEEIARFAFIWIIMLGATIAVKEGTHFSVDFLTGFNEKTERILHFIMLICMLIFALVFFIGGWQFVQFGLLQHSEIAGLPMVAIYISWPLAGLSWILFLTDQIHDFFAKNSTT